MHFRTIVTLTGLLAVVFTPGCGGKKKGKFTEEQMQTISLYSQTITDEEIFLAVESRLRPAAEQMDRQTFVSQTIPLIRSIVRDKVADILLYEESRKKAPEHIDEALDKAVEHEINRFVASF